MDILAVIFGMGVMVCLVIAKGIIQAKEYAKDEFLKQSPASKETDESENL
jgi:hypothetical protein